MIQVGKDMNCEMCKLEIDSQEHLLECHVVKSILPELKNTKVKYEDLFGSIEKIIPVWKLLEKISKAREDCLKMMTTNN